MAKRKQPPLTRLVRPAKNVCKGDRGLAEKCTPKRSSAMLIRHIMAMKMQKKRLNGYNNKITGAKGTTKLK